MNTKPTIEHEIAIALSDTCAVQAFAWLSRLPNCTHQRTTQLLNVYFDTPNQDLRQAKAALRLRFDTEAQCWIQTLKTAGRSEQGFSARQEWEVVLPTTETISENQAQSNPENIPSEQVYPQWQFDLFTADAQAILRTLADNLHAVFHTDYQRDIFDYQYQDDHFEIALDQGAVRLTDELSTALTPIKDLEIELIQGDLNRMQGFAEQIQTALTAQPQTLSKAARGYALMIETMPSPQ